VLRVQEEAVELFVQYVHKSGRHQIEHVGGSTNLHSPGMRLMGKSPAQLKRS
jgi:hypothetical protein